MIQGHRSRKQTININYLMKLTMDFDEIMLPVETSHFVSSDQYAKKRKNTYVNLSNYNVGLH